MIQALEDEKLRLIPLAKSDFELYYQLHSDEELMRYVTQPLSFDNARKSFQICLKNNNRKLATRYTWTVIIADKEQSVGIAGMVFNDNQNASIGTILHSSYHGKNIATRALKILIKYGFDVLSLAHITGHSTLDNYISVKLMTKLGFKFEKETEGKYRDKGYYWQKSLVEAQN